MAPMDDAVTVTDLVKTYHPKLPPAVDGISFSVARGETFGLLGPNGAGKTTTIGVLTTRSLPTSGRAQVDGVDVVEEPTRACRSLAVVSQRNNLDRSLTVRQNLLFHAKYHGIAKADRVRRADDLLERLGLTDKAKASVDAISGGQAQRVMIARALMHDPRVIFLDEPSAGLDPQSRLFVYEQIAHLREQGVTVLLTTHNIDEAARLCTRVGIIDHGKLLALDTPEALKHSLPGSTTVTLTLQLLDTPLERVIELLSRQEPVVRVEQIDNTGDTAQVRLYTDDNQAAVLPVVLATVSKLNVELRDVAIGTISLEDVFLQLTGRELR